LSTTSAAIAAPKTLADAIDVIEEAYEFMLAYAAQGRR
jgi:delta 1-pyrroline-5-carboxylate dehydrogenase